MVTAASQLQTGLRPLMGAPGFRFFKDLYPGGRAGGLNYYPFSSIKSGLTPSWTLSAAAPAASPANITVAIAAGHALLDAQPATLASGVNITITPEDVTNGSNYFRIFLNPSRKLQPVVPSGGVYTAPTTLLNGDAVADGDYYAECVDFPTHLEAHTFYKRVSGVWTKIEDLTFEPDSGLQGGRNRVFGNNTKAKVTSSNFLVNQLEVPIYIGTQFPIFGYQPARANLRNPASLEIATAELYYHVLPLPITATFTNGSDSVTVDYASRALFADIVASVTATTALEVDGAALAAGGYDAATGVITLGAAYAGDSGTKQVLVTPVTDANVYVLSLAKSTLHASENLTNP